MAKSLSVLNLKNFHAPATDNPHFYVQLLGDHIRQYEAIRVPHQHDFFCLFLFQKGSGIHTIDFREYDVAAGSLFFMSPTQVHSWKLSDDADGFVVFFNPQFYLLQHSQTRLAEFPFFYPTAVPYLLLEGDAKQSIAAIFVQMFGEYTGHEPAKSSILNSYLNILLLKIASLYSQARLVSGSSHVQHQIRQLEVLIETHYHSHQSVQDYANSMHLSVKQLYSICQTALRKSPSQLLHERLLLEAQRLLVHTDLSISQIAAELNYLDNSYFTRFFKKEAGLTPEQFRQRYR